MEKDELLSIIAQAIENKNRVSIKLDSGEEITGMPAPARSPELIKVHTFDGPTWIPIADIEQVVLAPKYPNFIQ